MSRHTFKRRQQLALKKTLNDIPKDEETGIPLPPPITQEHPGLFFVFTGEWGYEMLWSHGWLRKLKRFYPELFIGVASRGGAQILYEDFVGRYIDIGGILKGYHSDMSGIPLELWDEEEIEERCRKKWDGSRDKLHIVYSHQPWQYGDFVYQPGRPASVRDSKQLDRQEFHTLSLQCAHKQQNVVTRHFPGLLTDEYVVLQDRRRPDQGWGRKSYTTSTWRTVIDMVKDTGKRIVLVGYKQWKKKDAVSIFTSKEFQDLPGVINLTEFLSNKNRIMSNLMYQAVIFKYARYWLGAWGSAAYLKPFLGGKSYVLSAARAPKEKQQLEEKAFNNSIFSHTGGYIEYIDTELTKKSVLAALQGHEMFQRPDRPFLTVITRTCKRPAALQRCIDSVRAQSENDIQHLFIEDDRGRGLEWANKQFFEIRDQVEGEYVFLLDDDDKIIYRDFAKELKKIVSTFDRPDVIMCKQYIGDGLYPKPASWMSNPKRGQVGIECFVVKAGPWKQYIRHFGTAKAGDYFFIRNFFQGDFRIHWWDQIIAHAGIGRCQTEVE